MGRTWSAPSAHDSRILICTGPSGGPGFDPTSLELVDGARSLELRFNKNDFTLNVPKRTMVTIAPQGRFDDPDFSPIEKEATQEKMTWSVSADEVIYGDPDRVTLEDIAWEHRLEERGWYSAAADGGCGSVWVWDVLIQNWQCGTLVKSLGLPACPIVANLTQGLPNNTYAISGECSRQTPLKRNHLITA